MITQIEQEAVRTLVAQATDPNVTSAYRTALLTRLRAYSTPQSASGERPVYHGYRLSVEAVRDAVRLIEREEEY
jgi:hypothetical protein